MRFGGAACGIELIWLHCPEHGVAAPTWYSSVHASPYSSTAASGTAVPTTAPSRKPIVHGGGRRSPRIANATRTRTAPSLPRDGVSSGYGSMRTLCAQPAGLSAWSADGAPRWLVADLWLPRTSSRRRPDTRDQHQLAGNRSRGAPARRVAPCAGRSCRRVASPRESARRPLQWRRESRFSLRRVARSGFGRRRHRIPRPARRRSRLRMRSHRRHEPVAPCSTPTPAPQVSGHSRSGLEPGTASRRMRPEAEPSRRPDGDQSSGV